MTYVASTVLVGDQLYFRKVLEDLMACVTARTGEFHYRCQTLASTRMVYPSLVAAGDSVYVTGTEGWTDVIRAGPEVPLLAANKLDEKSSASGAVAGNRLWVRGAQYLYYLATA